jgi:hypothetical protein
MLLPRQQRRRSTATHHRLVVGVVEWRVDLVVCVSDLHVRSSTWALREKLLSREILVDKNGLTDLVHLTLVQDSQYCIVFYVHMGNQ